MATKKIYCTKSKITPNKKNKLLRYDNLFYLYMQDECFLGAGVADSAHCLRHRRVLVHTRPTRIVKEL